LRGGHKLSDPDALREMISSDVLQRPAVPELIEIDTTQLTAERAADAIHNRIRSIAGVSPASAGHLAMR
jgi:hypothetical protein